MTHDAIWLGLHECAKVNHNVDGSDQLQHRKLSMRGAAIPLLSEASGDASVPGTLVMSFSARFCEEATDIDVLIFVLSLCIHTSQISVSNAVDEEDRLEAQGGRPSIDVRIFKPLLGGKRKRNRKRRCGRGGGRRRAV